MADFMRAALGIAIAMVLVSSVVIQIAKTTNTSTWSATEVTLWGLISLVAIMSLIYGIANAFGMM